MVVLDHREKIYPEFDPAFRVDVETDWFAVTEGKIRKLDGEPGVSILRYQISDNQSQRIAPLALSPDDFLDQWIQLTWDDAKRWASSSNGALREWHTELSSLTTDSAEIESDRSCPGTGNGDEKWLVELSIDQQQNPSVKEERLYIEVAKRNGIFYVDAVLTAPPSGCPGKTPHRPLTDFSLPLWHFSVSH
jgi:hypothetical protein